MSTEAVPLANALDADALPLSDYRAMREGRAVPVVETPDAPAAEKPPAETAPDSETDEPQPDEKSPKVDKQAKKGEKLNARFSELTGKIKQQEQELAALRGAGRPAAELNTQPQTPTAQPTPAAPAAADVPPKADDFQDWDAFQRAVIRYELKQELKAESERTAKQTEASRAAELQRMKVERWAEQVTAARAKYPDFETVAQHPDLPVSAVMAEAITDTAVGADILQHLGRNPAEAARIAKLSPVAQVREIGKLEASLTANQAAAEAEEEEAEEDAPASPPKPQPISKAPAPARQLGGRTSVPAPASPRALEGMTQDEYRSLRESGRLR